jgi:hypothetical protein
MSLQGLQAKAILADTAVPFGTSRIQDGDTNGGQVACELIPATIQEYNGSFPVEIDVAATFVQNSPYRAFSIVFNSGCAIEHFDFNPFV